MERKRFKGHRLLGLALVAALVIGAVAGTSIVLASPGEFLLDKPGDTATVTGSVGGDAIFQFFNPGDPTGSGVFDPFVRISTNKNVEKGYNTSYRKLEYDENNSPTFTKDYLLSKVPLVAWDGKLYREFQCDVNQKNSADPSYYISLDKLELYVTNESKLHGYPFSGHATLVWQMKSPTDWIKINSLPNAGSGRRDFRVLIPASVFTGGDHVVLFSQFGNVYPNNGGYEEWGVRVGVTPPSPSIALTKYLKIDGGEWLDANEYQLVNHSLPVYFKIVVTNTGNVELTAIQLTDYFVNEGSPGVWFDLSGYAIPSSLAAGASFETIVGPFTAGYCWHTNTAYVSGVFNSQTYQDWDVAKYHGV